MSGGSAKQRRMSKRAVERLAKGDVLHLGDSPSFTAQDTASAKLNLPIHRTPGGAQRISKVFLADRWIGQLKNIKFVAVLLVAGAVIGQVIPIATAVQDIDRFIRGLSEPLKIENNIPVFHEPLVHLLFPYPPYVGQKPIPMWVMFYVTLHNTDHQSIWISNFFVTAQTRDKWIQLTPPRQPIGKNTLFFLVSAGLKPLKPEGIFSYKAANAPIPPDGYLSGLMYFESRVDNICKLDFTFYDSDGKVHRGQVTTVNVGFQKTELRQNGCGNKLVVVSTDGMNFDFEDNMVPLTPEFQEYMPYALAPQPPGKP